MGILGKLWRKRMLKEINFVVLSFFVKTIISDSPYFSVFWLCFYVFCFLPYLSFFSISSVVFFFSSFFNSAYIFVLIHILFPTLFQNDVLLSGTSWISDMMVMFFPFFPSTPKFLLVLWLFKVEIADSKRSLKLFF